MEAFFVEVNTYYQNSPSYFVGPFESREAADAWHANIPDQANVWLNDESCSGDIFNAWRIYRNPLTTTEALQHGMDDADENVISPDTRPTARALARAVRTMLS